MRQVLVLGVVGRIVEFSYQSPGVLIRSGGGTPQQVRDVQTDLRRLGYLESGIDGVFGPQTEAAVRALQFDLLKNDGKGSDGTAPVAVRSYNQSRVRDCSGALDQNLAACIADMLNDEAFCKVPSSKDPRQENKRIASEVAALKLSQAPLPFLLAILKQESGLKHYREPAPGETDNFVIVGLDRNAGGTPAITSRGYGVGQYTLFHHPPAQTEVGDFILDVRANVSKAVAELRDRFLRFVNGNSPGTRADDRQAEFGRGALRRCKYDAADPRHMSACRECLAAAGATDIQAGLTRFYAGASRVYEPTQYHPETEYRSVPVRANIGCDWPYAVRRYNGGGLDSYHYQTQVLLRVLNG